MSSPRPDHTDDPAVSDTSEPDRPNRASTVSDTSELPPELPSGSGGADRPGSATPAPIRPEMAIRPGRFDAAALLTIWFVRKSFYWLAFLGIISLAVTDHLDDTEIDWSSPSSLQRQVLSPLAALILAIVCRFLASQAGLALTYPLARRHDAALAPRDSFGSSIGVFFDRLHVMRAYRSLRWTHHVRQVALHRLGRWGRALARLDPILDIVNIGMAVLALASLMWLSADATA
jgi:hypothetical protein